MKYPSIKLALCFLITLFLSSYTAFGQIFLDGVVYNYVNDGKPVSVIVFEDQLLYENTKANKNGKFRIRLSPNHNYVISLSKEGHYTTKIAVDTHIPFSPDSEYFVEIPVETDLVQSYVGMDPEVMKKPLSRFYYNPKSETFVQDDKYLLQARQELEAFLYNAKKTETKDKEELEDPDLDKDIEEVDELADKKNTINFDTVEVYTASKNEEKKTYKELDELAEKDNQEESSSTKNQKDLASNSRSPKTYNSEPRSSGTKTVTENTDTQDSLADTSENNTMDNIQEEYEYVQNSKISIRINGKDYDSKQRQALIIDDSDIEVEIDGISEDDYSQLQYKLDGKDASFKALQSDEMEYEGLADGSYTFTLRNNQETTSSKDISVHFQIKTEESDSTWIYILAGIAALILIFILAKRRRKDEDKIER